MQHFVFDVSVVEGVAGAGAITCAINKVTNQGVSTWAYAYYSLVADNSVKVHTSADATPATTTPTQDIVSTTAPTAATLDGLRMEPRRLSGLLKHIVR